MKKNEILEGNKLIAEFNGLSYCTKYMYEGWYKNSEHNNRICDFDGLKYNTSWDWLMPIVMKIEELGYEVNIKGIKCSVNCVLEENPIISYVLGEKSKKIELLFTVIVEFIKWYNENNKNN